MSEEKKKDIKDIEGAVESPEEEAVSTDTEDTTNVEEDVPEEASDPQEDTSSTEESEETSDTDAQSAPTEEKKSNKTLLIGVGIAVAVAIALYIIFGGSMMATTKVSSNEAAAAIVNGVVVSEDDLQSQIADVEAFYAAQGQPLTEDIKAQMRIEALDALIGQELILQEAQAAGYAATDEDVQEIYDSEVVSYYGSDEAVVAALTVAGASKEQLLEDLAMRITISNFIEQNIDVESLVISDEEAQAIYDQTSAGIPNVPPFEDVVEEIKVQVQQQAVTEEIMALVDSMKTTADIEIK